MSCRIEEGTVLPVTASQVLLVKREPAVARRQLPPPNLPPELMTELPCGSVARATPSYKEAKKLASAHGDTFVDHDYPRKKAEKEGGEESAWQWRSAAKERADAVFLGEEGIESGAIVPGPASGVGFLSAVSALSMASRGRSKGLLEKSLPSKASQEHISKSANAIRDGLPPGTSLFRFSFFKWGQWVDIVVDDRIPFLADGPSAGARLQQAHHFGLALLEKAYAKLHGSYAAVRCISFFDALRDLTGYAVDLSWDIREIAAQLPAFRAGDRYYDPEELWKRFKETHSDDIVMMITGGDDRPAAAAVGGMEEMGLYPHTAYPIRAKETVTVKPAPGVTAGEDHLVYVDNKSADSPLWTGAWSERSGQWAAVSKSKAKSLRKVAERFPLGFWVSWRDLISSSSLLLFLRKERSASTFYGAWLPSRSIAADSKLSPTAGGCTAHVTWHRSPQYLLTAKCPGEVLVSLTQQEPLLFASGTGQGGGVSGALRIGFSLFGPVEENRTTKLHHLQNILRPVIYRNEVEVAECCLLPAAGKYVLVVTTWEPEESGKFCLRVQSASGSCLTSCKPLAHDVPPKKTFGGSVRAALFVRVVSAEGVQKRMLHAVHAYAEVTVDGVSKRTKADKEGGRSPFWDECFLFHLRKCSPSRPPLASSSSPALSKGSAKLKIEVWDSNMLIDTFAGTCHIDVYDLATAAARDWPGPTKMHPLLLKLEGRKSDKEEGKKISGSITLEFCYFLLPDFA